MFNQTVHFQDKVDRAEEKKKDFIRGRRWLIMLFLIGFGGVVTIFISISTITIYRLYYDLTIELLILLEQKTEATLGESELSSSFRGVILLPLISGLFVLATVSFTSCFAFAAPRRVIDKETGSYVDTRAASVFYTMYMTDDKGEEKKYCGVSYKVLFGSGYAILLLAVLMQVTGFIFTLVTLQRISDAVELSASGITTASQFEADVANLQYATFNECCSAQSWSRQGDVEQCDSEGNVVSCTISDPEFDQYQSQLCVCYTSTPEEYAEDISRIKESKVCDLMQDAIVLIEDSTRVVGFPDAANLNPNPIAPPPRGYGCGRGYARGHQYFLFQYIYSSSIYLTGIGTATSICQLGVLVIMACMMCAYWADKEDDDTFFDRVDGENMILATVTLDQMNKEKDENGATNEVKHYMKGGKPRFGEVNLNIANDEDIANKPVTTSGGKNESGDKEEKQPIEMDTISSSKLDI